MSAPDISGDHRSEPLSPELALVAPELAARARALLPEPGAPFWRTDAKGAEESPPEPFVFELPPSRLPEPPPRPFRELRTRLVRATAAAGAVVATVALLTLAADAARQTVTRTKVALPAVGVGAVPQQEAVTVVGWRAVAGAAYYDVQVYRGSAKIYEAWSTSPSVSLPHRWAYAGRGYTIEPGVYRVYAWPAMRVNGGTRAGAEITRTFQVGRAADASDRP